MSQNETDPQVTLPPARLYFLLARNAPVGVIFRRGPSSQVQLIKWNLKNDTFEPGQWFKGRIYERRSDLTPDGDLLVYFAAKQHARPAGTETWTAISHPPYLTALSFWFKGDAWSGGGLFEGNSHLKLNDCGMPHSLAPDSGKPKIKVDSLAAGRGENDPIELIRLMRDGWQLKQEMWLRMGAFPTEEELTALEPRFKDVLIKALEIERGELQWTRKGYRYAHNKGLRTEQPRILEKSLDRKGTIILRSKIYYVGFNRFWFFEISGTIPGSLPDLAGVNWAECDEERSRVVFAKAGALYAWQPGQPEPQLLADFNANRFEVNPPPDWAKKW